MKRRFPVSFAFPPQMGPQFRAAARPHLLLLALLAFALSCGETRARYELKLPELRTTLPNGLRVIVLPDDTTQLVAVDVRYEVGANEDPPGKEGLAHLVEHLMFDMRPGGSDQAPIMAALRQLTVYVNAYTTNDSTHYASLAPKENLEALLQLEAARMYLGCGNEETGLIIDQATFEREREVVRNEIRQRRGDPEVQSFYLLMQDAYPQGHPYSHDAGGNDETISNITLEDACQFMKDYYTPSRAILLVAGATTGDEMTPLVAQWFSALPAREAKARTVVAPIEITKRTVEHELDIDDTFVNVAWKLPAAYSEDDAAAGFMIGAVTGCTSAEGEDWDFVKEVGAQVLGGQLAPVFVVSVRLRSASDVGKALESVWRCAGKAHRGLSANSESMEDMRARQIASKVYAYESLNARTNEFGDYAQFDPDGGYFGGELQKIRTLSLGRVKSYLKNALSKDKALIVIIKAKEGAQKGDKRAALRYKAGEHEVRDQESVDAAEARMRMITPKSSVLAGAKRFTLGNGMRVVLLPSASSLPVMTVKLIFNAGTAHEPPDRAGLATIAGDYLSPPETGTGLGGDIESADPLGRVGAQSGVNVGDDHTVFTVRGLTIYQGILIKALERLIKVGVYDQDSIERYRKYYGFALQRRDTRARLAFERAAAAALFGADHPYTITGYPTEKSLRGLGRDVAMDFRGKHYTAKNATLVVAGNFDAAEVEGSIKDNFGDWGGGHEDEPTVVKQVKRDGAIVTGILGDERPHVEVRLAFPAPAGVDGQYAARLVLAEMLNLRMASVREKLGSSYGVYGGLSTKIGAGAYVMGGSIDAERAGESVIAMRAGIDSLRAGEGFDEDFVRARRTVLKDFLIKQTSSMALASDLEFLARYGLDEKYLDKLVRQIGSLSVEQVKELLASEIAPTKEIVIALGTRAQLEKTFAEAGLTATEWVETK